MFMLAMQVFANMFGLNMNQFSSNNITPLFEREVQKLLVNQQVSSPKAQSEASSAVGNVVNIKTK